MKEKDIRELLKKKKPEDDLGIVLRYSGIMPRPKNPREVSPKVEVEIEDVTDETVGKLVKP